MGLVIELQDEFGGKISSVADTKNWLPQLLEPLQDGAHPFLDSIDLYGDTVFNRLQMSRFLREWKDLAERASMPEVLALVSEIRDLALLCQTEVHRYVKFIGD